MWEEFYFQGTKKTFSDQTLRGSSSRLEEARNENRYHEKCVCDRTGKLPTMKRPPALRAGGRGKAASAVLGWQLSAGAFAVINGATALTTDSDVNHRCPLSGIEMLQKAAWSERCFAIRH